MQFTTKAIVALRVTLLPLVWFGHACAEPDAAAILAEQTQRRREEKVDRLAREQRFNRAQFERKLDRFDRRPRSVTGTTGRLERNRRLGALQQQETRSLIRQEQALDHLELETPGDDFRQRQEINRLRHRQRADAFMSRQELRLRRSRTRARGPR